MSSAHSQVILTPFQLQALHAFDPSGKALPHLTLSGTAVWTAGSLQESGSVTLTTGPDGATEETWVLPTQSHHSIETALATGKSCSAAGKDGVEHEETGLNCFRPVTWFAPWTALNLLSPGNLLKAIDTTSPADTEAGVVSLQFATQYPSVDDKATQARLSAVAVRAAAGVRYDGKTALPSTITFADLLDSDLKHAIEYVIVFADYRSEQGFVVPHRIQRYVQGTLQADITINSVSAN